MNLNNKVAALDDFGKKDVVWIIIKLINKFLKLSVKKL